MKRISKFLSVATILPLGQMVYADVNNNFADRYLTTVYAKDLLTGNEQTMVNVRNQPKGDFTGIPVSVSGALYSLYATHLDENGAALTPKHLHDLYLGLTRSNFEVNTFDSFNSDSKIRRTRADKAYSVKAQVDGIDKAKELQSGNLAFDIPDFEEKDLTYYYQNQDFNGPFGEVNSQDSFKDEARALPYGQPFNDYFLNDADKDYPDGSELSLHSGIGGPTGPMLKRYVAYTKDGDSESINVRDAVGIVVLPVTSMNMTIGSGNSAKEYGFGKNNNADTISGSTDYFDFSLNVKDIYPGSQSYVFVNVADSQGVFDDSQPGYAFDVGTVIQHLSPWNTGDVQAAVSKEVFRDEITSILQQIKHDGKNVGSPLKFKFLVHTVILRENTVITGPDGEPLPPTDVVKKWLGNDLIMETRSGPTIEINFDVEFSGSVFSE